MDICLNGTLARAETAMFSGTITFADRERMSEEPDYLGFAQTVYRRKRQEQKALQWHVYDEVFSFVLLDSSLSSAPSFLVWSTDWSSDGFKSSLSAAAISSCVHEFSLLGGRLQVLTDKLTLLLTRSCNATTALMRLLRYVTSRPSLVVVVRAFPLGPWRAGKRLNTSCK